MQRSRAGANPNLVRLTFENMGRLFLGNVGGGLQNIKVVCIICYHMLHRTNIGGKIDLTRSNYSNRLFSGGVKTLFPVEKKKRKRRPSRRRLFFFFMYQPAHRGEPRLQCSTHAVYGRCTTQYRLRDKPAFVSRASWLPAEAFLSVHTIKKNGESYILLLFSVELGVVCYIDPPRVTKNIPSTAVSLRRSSIAVLLETAFIPVSVVLGST